MVITFCVCCHDSNMVMTFCVHCQDTNMVITDSNMVMTFCLRCHHSNMVTTFRLRCHYSNMVSTLFVVSHLFAVLFDPSLTWLSQQPVSFVIFHSTQIKKRQYFGQNWPTLQRGFSATAELLVSFCVCACVFFHFCGLYFLNKPTMIMMMMMIVAGASSVVAHVQPGHLVFLPHRDARPWPVVRHRAHRVWVERRRGPGWSNDWQWCVDIGQLVETEGGEWLLWWHRAHGASCL